MLPEPPFCPASMLVRTVNRAINHQDPVPLKLEGLKNPLPHAPLSPARKPPMSIFPVAIPRGQITPGGSRTGDLQDRIQKLAVVRGVLANMALTAWQQVFEPIPFFVCQFVSPHLPPPEPYFSSCGYLTTRPSDSGACLLSLNARYYPFKTKASQC